MQQDWTHVWQLDTRSQLDAGKLPVDDEVLGRSKGKPTVALFNMYNDTSWEVCATYTFIQFPSLIHLFSFTYAFIQFLSVYAVQFIQFPAVSPELFPSVSSKLFFHQIDATDFGDYKCDDMCLILAEDDSMEGKVAQPAPDHESFCAAFKVCGAVCMRLLLM